MSNGVPSGSARQSGSFSEIAATVSVGVSPSNGILPVSISTARSRTPTRRALVHGFATRLLGDMYAAVPRMTPASVGADSARSATASDRLGAASSRTTCEAKVQYLHRAIRLQLDIRWLEVTVDDAVFVRRLERLRDLSCDRQRLIERDGALLNAIGKRRPVYQLQHERRQAGGFFKP